jgi:hypothetical protein
MNAKINNSGKVEFQDPKLAVLADEMNEFSVEELNAIIKDMDSVFEGKYAESSFSKEMMVVSFDKDRAVVEGFDGEVESIPTHVFYDIILKMIERKR